MDLIKNVDMLIKLAYLENNSQTNILYKVGLLTKDNKEGISPNSYDFLKDADGKKLKDYIEGKRLVLIPSDHPKAGSNGWDLQSNPLKDFYFTKVLITKVTNGYNTYQFEIAGNSKRLVHWSNLFEEPVSEEEVLYLKEYTEVLAKTATNILDWMKKTGFKSFNQEEYKASELADQLVNLFRTSTTETVRLLDPTNSKEIGPMGPKIDVDAYRLTQIRTFIKDNFLLKAA